MDKRQTKNKGKNDQKKLRLAKKRRNNRRIKKELLKKENKQISGFIFFRQSSIKLAGLAAGIMLLFIFSPFSYSQSKNIRCSIASDGKSLPLSSFYNGSRNPYLGSVVIRKNPKILGDVLGIVKKTPMERMAKDIANRKRPVAAYLIGIAMKESKFGIYAPKKNGRDCYNYWGYRGRENPTASGYSCFNSPRQAVKIVGDRIESMINRGADNPREMIAWKCGSSCDGHSVESVNKWISDVSIHYYQLNPAVQVAKK
jgi:hypothetical protein